MGERSGTAGELGLGKSTIVWLATGSSLSSVCAMLGASEPVDLLGCSVLHDVIKACGYGTVTAP